MGLLDTYRYTYGYENVYIDLTFSMFHELTNDIIELCEMAGDRSKIKTNHAWIGPKRGGDTRAYTVLTNTNFF